MDISQTLQKTTVCISETFSRLSCIVEPPLKNEDCVEELNAQCRANGEISKQANKKLLFLKPFNRESKENSALKKSEQLKRREKHFLCTDCEKSFTRKSSLIVHQRIHTGEKRYVCIECSKRFGLKSSLVRHLRTHTPKTLNICPDCGKCFTRYSSLFQHQKVHRREKPYKRSWGEKSFSQVALTHRRRHQGEKLCEQTCKDNLHETTGDIHSQGQSTEGHHVSQEYNERFCELSGEHTGEKYPACKHDSCGANPVLLGGAEYAVNISDIYVSKDKRRDGTESFLDKVNQDGIRIAEVALDMGDSFIDMEKLAHRDDKHFLCTDCEKSFTRKSSLIVHQRIHTGEKRYVCIECSKRFGLKSSLVRHLRTHTPKTLNICPDCGKCFTRYSSLFQHQKVHRREKPYKRSWGEKSFSQVALTHRRIHKHDKSEQTMCQEHLHDQTQNNVAHNTEDPHAFQECELRTHTDTAESLNNNEVILHSRSKKHVYPAVSPQKVCPNEMEEGKSKREEELYIKNRKDDICFLCLDCGKSFTRKSSLIVHQRIHTGEKRYVCTDCSKRFGLKSSLVRHLRTHREQTLNICSQCSIYFSRYSDLMLHLEVHDGTQDTQGELSALRDQKWPPSGNEPASDHNASGSLRSLCNEDRMKAVQESEQRSLQIKEESSGDVHENIRDEFPVYPYSLDWGEELDISKALGEDENTELMTKTEGEDHLVTEAVIGSNRWDGASQSEIRVIVTEKKHFLCLDCGKSFTRKSSLIVHQRIHTGEKRYVCTDCGKRFGLKSSWVRHQKTHNTQKLL
ncbi:zinc finger protein 271-like [Bombina bombina]|uniref:zinc finger protein 271-like n=1 Tax=Bombina bombina TaxID=8345 RepID=UPI00235B08F8|nr:zinc finger protein 271-like [Bombina bombina]